MTKEESALATFVSELSVTDIPDKVRDHAGLVLADTIGVLVGGSTDDAVRGLTDEVDSGSSDAVASILGTDQRTRPARAALVNGTAGTMLELDEGHKYATGHPAIHVVPTVLAEGERGEYTVPETVTALVAGYEVATRVARACYPLGHDYHPHGVWGAVGSAATLANYRGLGPEKTLAAMQIAANQAQHTRMEAAIEGATVRNTYAGTSNLGGFLAFDFATAGFTPLESGIERHLERITEGQFETGVLNDELGERWDITGGYFKNHAACRHIHPTLDAVETIQNRVTVEPNIIENVLVETYPSAANLTPRRPANSLQAKFSLPFAVATRICNGKSNKQAFEEEAINDEVLAFADCVNIRIADDIAGRLPDARGSRVTVQLSNGEELTEEVKHARGGTERPWSEDELRMKFESLVTPVLGDDATECLWIGARRWLLTPEDLARAASTHE